jgi:hypothetical protein
MSKTKLSVALLLICAAMSAFAQSNGPMTIQEYTNRQAEIRRAEMESKLLESQRKNHPAVAVAAPIARTCDDDLTMYAVYGIGNSLRADFGYRGATITAAPHDRADMGGWTVEELTPTRAIMVKTAATGKRSGKGKHREAIAKRCPLYLSAGVREFAAPPVAPVAPDTSTQVLPIPPMPSPMASTPKAGAAGRLK